MRSYSLSRIIATIGFVALLIGGTVFYIQSRSTVPRPTATATTSAGKTSMPSPPATTSVPATNTTPAPSPQATKPVIVPPIAEFQQRITKKHFGQYITPATSPVQPERFTGYHTGVDVEYTDTTTDVPIYAVVDATVVRASWVSGYGGLLVLKGIINGQSDYILYGHVRQSSLPAVGSTVTQGQQVGVLGTGYSHETDGERHHLHFAIYTKSPVDIRGYVPAKADLAGWIDPLSLYK